MKWLLMALLIAVLPVGGAYAGTFSDDFDDGPVLEDGILTATSYLGCPYHGRNPKWVRRPGHPGKTT